MSNPISKPTTPLINQRPSQSTLNQLSTPSSTLAEKPEIIDLIHHHTFQEELFLNFQILKNTLWKRSVTNVRTTVPNIRL